MVRGSRSRAATVGGDPVAVLPELMRGVGSEGYTSPFVNVTPVPLTIPPHAVRLRSMPPPPDATDAYVQRFNAAVAEWWVAPMWYTPAEASHIMEYHNGRNRPLSGAWKRLQAKINGGVWFMNAETIVFGSDGHLLNGQHRMKATSLAQMAVPMLVVFNVNPNVFMSLDQGLKRTPGDVLATYGVADAKLIAASLGWLLRYESDSLRSAWVAVPNETANEALDRHKGIVASVERVRKTDWNKSRVYPQSVLVFLHYLLSRIDAKAAAAFLEKIVDGVGVERGSHEFLLRRRLEKDFSNVNHYRNYVEMVVLTLKTWINIRSREKPGNMIVWRDREPIPQLDAITAAGV